MALADHAVKPATKQCAYAKALRMLTKADAATLAEWMSGGVPAAQMADNLRKNNTPYVGDTVISEHRRGACVCAR